MLISCTPGSLRSPSLRTLLGTLCFRLSTAGRSSVRCRCIRASCSLSFRVEFLGGCIKLDRRLLMGAASFHAAAFAQSEPRVTCPHCLLSLGMASHANAQRSRQFDKSYKSE
jgi:hypothetical protein